MNGELDRLERIAGHSLYGAGVNAETVRYPFGVVRVMQRAEHGPHAVVRPRVGGPGVARGDQGFGVADGGRGVPDPYLGAEFAEFAHGSCVAQVGPGDPVTRCAGDPVAR